MGKHTEWQASTEGVCAHYIQRLAVNISILSPCDEAGGDGGPGDAAGVGLLALLLVVLAAAAQAAQVDGEA